MIGDCYGLVVEEVLTKSQPYPGDERWSDAGINPTERFSAKRGRNGLGYWIRDKRTRLRTLLPQQYVENGKFNLPNWYAKLCARNMNWEKQLNEKIKFDRYYNWQIDDTIHLVATKLLEDEIISHFPNTNPETDSDSRFSVYQKDWGSNVYIINDLDLEILTEIPRDLLNTPQFDLIGWYCELLRNTGVFYKKYKELHIEKYNPNSNHRRFEDDDCLNPVSHDLEDEDLFHKINNVLTQCQPYPGDEQTNRRVCGDRFVMDREMESILCIYDRMRCLEF